MDKVRFGLIGVGNRGIHGYLKILNQYFVARAQIVALSDSSQRRLQEIRREFGKECRYFSDYRKMLLLPNLDVVIITTPDFTHEQIAIDALEVGKHVICEKPLAITAKGCDRVIQASVRAGKILQLGLVLRYTSFHRKLKALVDARVVGNVRTVSMLDYYNEGKTYFRRWNRFERNTGGLLIHKGCHAFDILNWLVDSPPQRVGAFGGLDVFKPEPGKPLRCRDYEQKYSCHGSALLDPQSWEKAQKMDYSDFDLCLWNSQKDTHDNSTVMIEYENKGRASYTGCFFSVRMTRCYSVVGDEGEIEADSVSSKIKVYSLSSRDTITYDIGSSVFAHGGGDKHLLDAFFTCVRERKEPLADGQAGKLSVLVGLAAEKSVRERRIVEISELQG